MIDRRTKKTGAQKDQQPGSKLQGADPREDGFGVEGGTGEQKAKGALGSIPSARSLPLQPGSGLPRRLEALKRHTL